MIFNFIMAGAIALIILVMASIKDNRLKAIVYGLPFPITIALITTKTPIDSSHVIGLFLLCFFLWTVFGLHKKWGLPILIADGLTALVYISLGFLSFKYFSISFWQAVFLYVFFWIIYVWRYTPIDEQGSKKSRIHPLIKGIVVFPITLFLFFLKSILKGIVVTFPFSGVFAVVEAKDALYTLAGEFTKNSLAILILFIVIKIFFPYLGFYRSIGLGWLFYVPSLLLCQKIKK